jgi:ribosomal protein S18 acetylase RimI-like enzyme
MAAGRLGKDCPRSLVENRKCRENQHRKATSKHWVEKRDTFSIVQEKEEYMIIEATEKDGPQIKDIAARAGVFSREEVDCVGEIVDEYLSTGSEICGYHFIAYREGEQVLGFACYGPRDLADGVYDLYWIAVDPNARRGGVGRSLLAESEQAVHEIGGRMLIAETSGTAHYESTREFYTSLGYNAEATIKDFYTQGDDLVIFVKRF